MSAFRRFRVPAAAILSILSGSTFANAGGADNTPALNDPGLPNAYALQSFDEHGKTNEVAITDTLQNAYFFTNCSEAGDCYKNIPKGTTIFKVPSGFGTTPDSHYPRSELRSKVEFKAGQNFKYTQAGRAYIVQEPATKSIIFAQIHGDKVGGSEMFKLRWKNGTIEAGIKENYGDKEKRYMLFQNVGLDEPIDYTLEAAGSSEAIRVTINIAVRGQSVSKMYDYPKAGWNGVDLYFKAGNYNQDSRRGGPDAVVAYSALKLN